MILYKPGDTVKVVKQGALLPLLGEVGMIERVLTADCYQVFFVEAIGCKPLDGSDGVEETVRDAPSVMPVAMEYELRTGERYILHADQFAPLSVNEARAFDEKEAKRMADVNRDVVR